MERINAFANGNLFASEARDEKMYLLFFTSFTYCNIAPVGVFLYR